MKGEGCGKGYCRCCPETQNEERRSRICVSLTLSTLNLKSAKISGQQQLILLLTHLRSHTSFKSINSLKEAQIDETQWNLGSMTWIFQNLPHVLIIILISFMIQYGHWEADLRTPWWASKWLIPATYWNSRWRTGTKPAQPPSQRQGTYEAY